MSRPIAGVAPMDHTTKFRHTRSVAEAIERQRGDLKVGEYMRRLIAQDGLRQAASRTTPPTGKAGS